MNDDWGRFTVRGSAELESRMAALMVEIRERCAPLLPPDVCRSMVLFGGYGKGEGGVEIVDGAERPHNNLDFLIILQPECRQDPGAIKTRVCDALQPLSQSHGLAFDLSVISAAKLRTAPSLVMWYDMRYGHKCVLGDKDFLPSQKHFSVERIPAWDAWTLLINRGTLLIINKYLDDRRPAGFDARKLLVRHAMKAIIGCGDALLYFLGAYHWSYQEKQRRMREQNDVSPHFRALYDEAVEFRFKPHYEDYLDRDLYAWTDSILEQFEPLHLQCESNRLGCLLTGWTDYPAAVLTHAVFEDFLSWRAWAKKCYNTLRYRASCSEAFLARIGYQCMGPKGRMLAAYPAVAYNVDAPALTRMAAQALGARNEQPAELRRAYLAQWNQCGDSNFAGLLRSANLTLEPEQEQV